MCTCLQSVFVDVLVDLRQAQRICSVSKAIIARNFAAVPLAIKLIIHGFYQTINVAFAGLQLFCLLRSIGRCT